MVSADHLQLLSYTNYFCQEKITVTSMKYRRSGFDYENVMML